MRVPLQCRQGRARVRQAAVQLRQGIVRWRRLNRGRAVRRLKRMLQARLAVGGRQAEAWGVRAPLL